MKSWERWIVLAAVLGWPIIFAFVSGPLNLEPWLSNLVLVVGWALILGIFVWRIYQSAAFLRADVAREQTDDPDAVVSAALLKTNDPATPRDGFIVVMVADAAGIRLVGRNSAVVGESTWRGVLKLTPLDRNIVLLVARPDNGDADRSGADNNYTEEWRLTPTETGLIRAVTVDKRDALVARLEALRANA